MLHALVPSPLGDLLLTFDDAALLGVHFADRPHVPAVAARGPRDDAHPIARLAAEHLARYFRGERTSPGLPIRLQGTPFQRTVWDALRSIGHGDTVSYAALARRVGAPAAVRAVGAAVGRNPVSILLPCHRVVGSDGSLTGYAGGLPRKTALLRLERALGDDGRARAGDGDRGGGTPVAAGRSGVPA